MTSPGRFPIPDSRLPDPTSPPRRILIVRLSALGDLVHTLPLAENARRVGVEVGWLTERAYAPLLEGNPAITQVFLADTRRWRRSPASAGSRSGFQSLKSDLATFAPDFTIDAQGLWKSAILAKLAGAPVIGLGVLDRRERTSSVLVDRPVRLDPALTHVVDQNLSLLAPLEIPVSAPEPDARYLLALIREEADNFVSEVPRPFVLLHPGASRAKKSWGEERYAALGRRLLEEKRMAPVISWGPGDEERASKLARLLPEAVSLPPLDFAGLAHVSARAALFVGGDTGPVHLADALGVPTLAFFSPDNRRNVPARNRPYRGASMRYDQAEDLERVLAMAVQAARCPAAS